jgi:type I restriction enzyme S subunit
MKLIWPTKKLGEICKICTGKKDVDEGNPNGEYPFFSCSREITYSDTYSFDTEAILVAGNGDVGNTKIYKGKFEAYQRTYVLDGFKEDIKYIYYYLIGNLKKILVRSKSGSTMPYIRKGDLENLEIPLPSLPIQQKIVKVLDAIQEGVEMQEKIIENTKELKKSLLNEIFNSKGKNQKSKLQFKIQNYEELGKICSLRKEQVLPRSVDKYVGLEHLDSGEVKIKKWGRGSEVKSLKNKFYPGDILYGKLRAYLDKAALADFEGVASTDILVIMCEKRKLLPNYLIHFIHTPKFLNFAISTTVGTNHPRTSWNFLKLFQIPLPPLPEQQEIAEIFQTVDQKIEIEQKKKVLYEELFKTMLNKIMNQEIDVEKIDI